MQKQRKKAEIIKTIFNIKIFLVLSLIVLSFMMISCDEPDYTKIINDALDTLPIDNVAIDKEIKEDVTFPKEVKIDDYTIALTWITSDDALTSEGKVTRDDNDVTVIVSCKGELNGITITKEIGSVIVLKKEISIDYNTIIERAIDYVTILSPIEDTIILPNTLTIIEDKDHTNYEVSIVWETNSDILVITNNNDKSSLSCTNYNNDTIETIKATYKLNTPNGEITKVKEYRLEIKKKEVIDYESIVKKAIDTVVIPESMEDSIILPDEVTIEDNKYTIQITWKTTSKLLDITSESNNYCLTCNDRTNDYEGKIEGVYTLVTPFGSITKSKEYTIKVIKEEIVINYEEIFNKALTLLLTEFKDKNVNTLNENIVSWDIIMIDKIIIDEYVIAVTYETNNTVLDNKGITYPLEEEDMDVIITVTLSLDDKTYTSDLITVTVLSLKSLAVKASQTISIPLEINDDISLPTLIDHVEIQWQTNNRVLTSDGICAYTKNNVNVNLMGLLIVTKNDLEYFYDASYDVVVKPYSPDKRFELIVDQIEIPEEAISNITLPTSFKYDVTGTWSSSNPDVISDSGIVKRDSEDKLVIMILTLLCDDSTADLTFYVNVPKIVIDPNEEYFTGHNLIDRAMNYNTERMSKLELNNNRLELMNNELIGVYESKIFTTNNFTELVGSWSCITSPVATCELEISVRVNNKWSKYFTYGEWGLGKANYYYNSSDSIAKIATDEIVVLNSASANGIKYRVTLRRVNVSDKTPSLSLVACALYIPGYSYPVDSSSFPSSYDNDLPKLYQYDVPTIGGSICSATTTTMLLKYKGFSFTDKGYAYEHEYMAHMVADPGHNNPTYGNWSYNMATAGAFGVNAYVARMYSWDEVRYHLINVGPMGASIAGQFGSYHTNGHLIVVRGYRVSGGNTTVICNDPAVRNVYYEVSLDTFLTCFRNVAYVIEK